MAAPTYDTSASRLFPCEVVVAGTPLGGTLRDASVDVRFLTDYADHGYAQAGTRPTEVSIVGDAIEVEMQLAELSPENYAVLFPGRELVEDGDDWAMKGNSRVGAQAVRDGLYSTVIIKPIINGQVTTDENLWITIYRAFPRIETATLAFSLQNQQAITVMWMAFPDPTKENDYFALGKTSILTFES